MINAINLSILRNAEFIQFCNDFTSLVNTNNPTTLSLKPQYDAMLLKTTELENLFKNETSSPISAEIENLDLRRDQAVNGIIGLIHAYAYHYDPDMHNSSVLLQNNLKLYNAGIARENYQSETAIINKLIVDWETKPDLSNAIDLLGLQEWKIELKTANLNFNEKYLARTQEYATASQENQKSKRAEVMTAYYDLRKFLEAFSVIQPTPAYAKTINEVNALIEQYNALLKARAGASKKTTKADPVTPS